jgi:very-short-patch-repair endonuclease
VADRQRNYPAANARAKRLRKQLTPAEVRLWNLLRRLDGFHFRRQLPVGRFTFDFGDFGFRILIELDGGIHNLPEVMERDRIKDAWAASQGFAVVRIPNSYVFGSGEEALAIVLQAARNRTNGRRRSQYSSGDPSQSRKR